VLFIDELHTLVGAGAAEGAMDASNMLKPALARGELRCIGATTLNEYRKHIEKDGALERRFQPVFVGEPSLPDTISILRGLKEKYEVHHGIRIQDGALVAAAKLRRAQDAAVAARPYATKMREVITSLVAEADPESNPLFVSSPTPRTMLLVPMTSDRGLCGAFNSSLLRRVEKLLRDQAGSYERIEVAAVGRKGRTYFRRRPSNSSIDTSVLVNGANTASAHALAEVLVKAFLETEVDEVYLVYNEFKSALTQIVVVEPLLPLSQSASEGIHLRPYCRKSRISLINCEEGS
jgi:hypothetical protein